MLAVVQSFDPDLLLFGSISKPESSKGVATSEPIPSNQDSIPASAQAVARMNASLLSAMLGDSVNASGLLLDGNISLRAGVTGLGSDYEKGCVIARVYEHGEPLEEGTLLAQLDEMIAFYEAVLADPKYAHGGSNP